LPDTERKGTQTMTTHDPRPPQWPPATATATYEYLAAYERTDPTAPGADQQVWDQVRAGGRGVLEEHVVGIVLVGLSPEATQRLGSAHTFDPDLTSADFDPVSTLVTDHGWAWAEDSDAMWELVRSWPGLVGGAIPVVTGR